MPTTPAGSLESRTGEIPSVPKALLITVPDAERLLLQSRFVTNQLEAEILSDLEARIRAAELVDPSGVPPDLVTMNSQIVLRDAESGQRTSLTLAFPSSANARKGKVSVLTPLGSILLGARTGQSLTCPISGTISTVIVEAILRQPEAAGDYYG